ncbi:MAG: response regulator [Anaerolineaceae bacterium]|nr:response regulator [Anaerolineaceae bacterium]
MLNSLRTLLKGPQFDDPDKTRVAQLVWAMSVSFFVVTFFVCVLFAHQIPEQRWLSLTIFLIVSSFTVGTLCLLRQNRVYPASQVLTFNVFLGLVFNGYFYGGIRSINGPAFIILLLIAGLLLGIHALRTYTFISIGTIVMLYLLEAQGFIGNSNMGPVLITDVGIIVAAVSIASVLLHTAINSIHQGYLLLSNALKRLKSTTVSKIYVENILASMQDMLFVITPDTRIDKVNQAVLDLLGYTEEALLGQPLQMVLAPEERPLWQQPTTIHSPLFAMRDQELRFLAKDGRVIETAVSTAVMKEENTAAHSIVCVANDITQRKQFERELKAAKAVAEEAAKVKSEFLASMSHEIRTPLNAVIGMTSLLLDTPLTAEQEDYVSTARTSGSGLLAIINDILDFSKIDSGKLELDSQTFILRECVEEAIDLLAVQATAKNLFLNSFIEPDVPTIVQSDVTRLRQVLVNLLGNAVKFTAEGEINLWVGCRQHDGETELQFMVKDTGIGIPADRMNRLFEPFRQVDSSTTREFGGTGLGLVISKRLINLMGGDISVESTPGVGTVFYFTIKTEAAADWGGNENNDLQEAGMPFVGKRVLVAHKNQTSRVVLTRQLQQWGIEAACTSSTLEMMSAITLLPRFDLLIVDASVMQQEGNLQSKLLEQTAVSHSHLLLFTPMGQQCSIMEEQPNCYGLSRPYHTNQLRHTLTEIFANSLANRRLTAAVSTQSQFNNALAGNHPLRILLAEDNLINQKVALRMLERLGYRADVAANGAEVVHALTLRPYDLILMDIQMPEMDGIEATQRIREGLPPQNQPRIVAMTANALAGDREACLTNGMDDYVSKPIKVEELTRVLQSSQSITHPL